MSYDLRDLKAFQVERLDKLLLCRIECGRSEDRLDLAGCSSIHQCDLLDLGKALQHRDEAQINPLPCQLSAQQGTEQQRQHAVKAVNANLLIGPVMHGTPTDKVRILHPLEGFLNMMLASVCPHDVFVWPGLLIGKENVDSQEGPLEAVPSGVIDVITQA